MSSWAADWRAASRDVARGVPCSWRCLRKSRRPRHGKQVAMFENLTEKLQRVFKNLRGQGKLTEEHLDAALGEIREADRKSTRLNSSHLVISYAVFCLKKKKRSNKSATRR